MKKFKSLEIVAKKLVETYSSGIHFSPLKDSLIEVDVVHDYQPGDKRLDSKSSLKMNRIMSRVFNPERSLNVFIILDLSSSVFSVLDYSITTALCLAYLADRSNDKVGLCVFSDKIMHFVEPSQDYLSVISLLEKSYDKFDDSAHGTSIEKALERTANISLNNTLFFLISDFYYDINDYKFIKILSTSNNKLASVVLFDNRDFLNIDIPLNISFLDVEEGQNFDCTFEERNYSWLDNLSKNLVKANSEVIVLDIEKNDFLLPLFKYLVREAC